MVLFILKKKINKKYFLEEYFEILALHHQTVTEIQGPESAFQLTLPILERILLNPQSSSLI